MRAARSPGSGAPEGGQPGSVGPLRLERLPWPRVPGRDGCPQPAEGTVLSSSRAGSWWPRVAAGHLLSGACVLLCQLTGPSGPAWSVGTSTWRLQTGQFRPAQRDRFTAWDSAAAELSRCHRNAGSRALETGRLPAGPAGQSREATSPAAPLPAPRRGQPEGPTRSTVWPESVPGGCLGGLWLLPIPRRWRQLQAGRRRPPPCPAPSSMPRTEAPPALPAGFALHLPSGAGQVAASSVATRCWPVMSCVQRRAQPHPGTRPASHGWAGLPASSWPCSGPLAAPCGGPS